MRIRASKSASVRIFQTVSRRRKTGLRSRTSPLQHRHRLDLTAHVDETGNSSGPRPLQRFGLRVNSASEAASCLENFKDTAFESRGQKQNFRTLALALNHLLS